MINFFIALFLLKKGETKITLLNLLCPQSMTSRHRDETCQRHGNQLRVEAEPFLIFFEIRGINEHSYE